MHVTIIYWKYYIFSPLTFYGINRMKMTLSFDAFYYSSELCILTVWLRPRFRQFLEVCIFLRKVICSQQICSMLREPPPPLSRQARILSSLDVISFMEPLM